MNELDDIQALYGTLASVLRQEPADPGAANRPAKETIAKVRERMVWIVEEARRYDLFADEWDVHSFIERNIDAPVADMNRQLDCPWLLNKMLVGFAGLCGTGKTTAANLVTGSELPMSRRGITVPMPTYIYHGAEGDDAMLVDHRGKGYAVKPEEIQLLTYWHYRDDGIKKLPIDRIFSALAQPSRCQALEDVTLLDLPGLNGIYPETATQAAAECHVIFWFINATRGGFTPDEIKYIKENLCYADDPEEGKPMYIVITHADDVESLDAVTSRVKETAEREGFDVRGYYTLGRTPEMQNDFKNSVYMELLAINGKIPCFRPMPGLLQTLKVLGGALAQVREVYSKECDKKCEEARAQVAAYRAAEDDDTRLNSAIASGKIAAEAEQLRRKELAAGQLSDSAAELKRMFEN